MRVRRGPACGPAKRVEGLLRRFLSSAFSCGWPTRHAACPESPERLVPSGCAARIAARSSARATSAATRGSDACRPVMSARRATGTSGQRESARSATRRWHTTGPWRRRRAVPPRVQQDVVAPGGGSRFDESGPRPPPAKPSRAGAARDLAERSVQGLLPQPPESQLLTASAPCGYVAGGGVCGGSVSDEGYVMLRSLRKRLGVAATTLVIVGLMAPMAAAGYWTWQRSLSPTEYVGYFFGSNDDETWMFRQSRSNCNAKMQLRNRGGSFIMISIPGGCNTSDYTRNFFTGAYDVARSINQGASDVFVNVRIAPV
jgi:hypothetical protein